MVFYDTCGIYVQSQTTIDAKIIAIDAVIDNLILSQSGVNVNTNEYHLNDGQTIIRQIYRGPKQIAEALMFWEGVRQMYINRQNGRVHRLVDIKNFNGFNGSTR